MKQKKALYYSPDVIMYPLLFVMLVWIAFWLELRFQFKFLRWGIYPLRLEGLLGIIFGPFIHGDLRHLFNNSVPLFALSATLFYFYRGIRWKVLLWGTLATGVLTWFIGRPAMHIGASGVVYMLAAFLFFKGILSKRLQLIAISLIVVFLYGGLLWYLFPIDPKISWEGHVSGFVVGIALAFILKQNLVQNKKYAWERDDYDPEKDEFLKHFDEDGHFIESIPEETIEDATETASQRPRIKINYILKKKRKDTDS